MTEKYKLTVLLLAVVTLFAATRQAIALSPPPLPLVSTVPVSFSRVTPDPAELSGEGSEGSDDRSLENSSDTQAELQPAQTPEPPAGQSFLPFVYNRLPLMTASVLLQEGSCCAGGTAGETIEIQAAYQAQSRADAVVEMRTHARAGSCLNDETIAPLAWKPFSAAETFTNTLVTNWVGFYVSAQFRDAAGNVSEVVCDDISLEGMPPLPTSGAPQN